jgi:DNA-binding NtrC family response regulator
MSSSVLIVDDELGMRELMKRWLTNEEYVALEARTAEEAVDVAGGHAGIKVAIVDLQMPGLGGAWLVYYLRSVYPAISVILATANDSVPGTLTLKPNVVGYVVKPLTATKVLPLVAEGVRRCDDYIEAQRRTGGADPIESFLDRKLTRGDHGDDHTK